MTVASAPVSALICTSFPAILTVIKLLDAFQCRRHYPAQLIQNMCAHRDSLEAHVPQLQVVNLQHLILCTLVQSVLRSYTCCISFQELGSEVAE